MQRRGNLRKTAPHRIACDRMLFGCGGLKWRGGAAYSQLLIQPAASKYGVDNCTLFAAASFLTGAVSGQRVFIREVRSLIFAWARLLSVPSVLNSRYLELRS